MFNFYKNDIVFLGIFFISILFNSTLIAQISYDMITFDDSWIELVKDIRPGYLGSDPQKIFNVNGTAFFVAYSSSGFGLWKSDGTDAGTQLVVDLDEPDINFNYEEFTVFKNQLFFRAADTQIGFGSELWATDGTAEGTRLISDIFEGPSSGYPSFITIKDSVLLFLASSEDPVTGGIETELWRSDGTTEGTYMVKDIWPGPYHTSGGPGIDGYTSSAVVNGIYYFAAKGLGEDAGDNYIGGLELWRSDGTETGTYIVTDLTPIFDAIFGAAWSRPHNLTNFKNKLLFSANSTDTGNEIFQSDGTPSGTTILKDICSDGVSCCTNNNSSFPSDFIVVDSLLFFIACDGVHGRELWKTDGTEVGTNLVIDLTPGEENTTITQQTAFNGMLYFVYDDGDENHGNELWKTDGTAVGTILVKDIAAGVDAFERANNSNPQYLTVVNNLLYFSAWTPEYGTELWRTDGTEIGTWMVEDIHTAEGWGSYPNSLANINGTLFFSARSYYFVPDNIDTGYELWKVNYVPTAVNRTPNKIDYNLSQNYPNPFNPTTTITFSIPAKEIVSLKIIDILGKEVKTLVNEQKQKGNYKIEFDASGLSSGIYFYRLQSGDFIATKKLLLLK